MALRIPGPVPCNSEPVHNALRTEEFTIKVR